MHEDINILTNRINITVKCFCFVPMKATRKKINPLLTDRLNGKPVRIFQPQVNINGMPNAYMMSIELARKYTRIDFEFRLEASNRKMYNLTISPKIRIVTPPNRLTFQPEKDHFLIYSENAPISPNNYKPRSNDDRLYFTLYFEPIPMDTMHFDIVESDDEERKIWMNLYDINLRKGDQTWEIKSSAN